VKIGFLKYPRISGQVWFPNASIGYKEAIWQEAVLFLLGVTTNIRGMERSDQENERDGKIALVHEHN